MSGQPQRFRKDAQYYKFCLYGFFKNLRFFEPFYMLFFLEKGLNYLQIGSLYAISEVMINILNVPTGIIADSFGRRKSMIFSFSFYIISFVIFYFSTGYLFLLIAVLIFASGDAFRQGTHKAMIFEYLKIHDWEDQKVHYYGHTRSYSQFGSAISSLIAASIVFYSGSYQYVFLFSMLPYLMDLILMLTYPKELDGHIKQLESNELWNKMKQVFKEFIFSFKELYVLKGSVNLAIFTGFYSAVKDYLQPVLKTFALGLPILLLYKDKQRSAVVIGLVYFVLFLITSFSSRASGKISARFAKLGTVLNLTLLTGFLAGMISGIFYHIGITWISVLFFLIIYIIENLRKPMAIGYVAELFDQKILATALSGAAQLDSIFTAIIALMLGFFADRFGVANSLIIISIIMILSLPLYLIKRKHKYDGAGKN